MSRGHQIDPNDDNVRATLRAMRVDVLTAEVTAGLQRTGVRSILLKGPVIASWLYPQPARRTYVDCDLLVSPTDFPEAERVLERLGFVRVRVEVSSDDWARHAATWFRPPEDVVDLHHTLVGVGAPDSILWSAVAGATARMTVAGHEVEVLGPDARVLLVGIYAAKDGAKGGRSLDDLRHALDRLPLEDWQKGAILARSVDATEAFAAGLRMLPRGGALAERLALTDHRSTEVALRARGAPPLSVGLMWLASSDGPVAIKLKVAFRKIFPPPSFLRAWTPLARRGRVGLLAAYVWRPVWVAWHLWPALRAWTVARREDRRNRRSSP